MCPCLERLDGLWPVQDVKRPVVAVAENDQQVIFLRLDWPVLRRAVMSCFVLARRGRMVMQLWPLA